MTAGRSVGVFGGSFDPIHNGHLVAALAVSEALELDKLLIVPANNQWQKNSATTPDDRLAMARLAFAGMADIEVSTVDIDRGGPTYTIDTLTDLARIYPGDKLFFILGTDSMASIESWQDAAKLFDLAQFVVITRPGSDLSIPEIARGRVWYLEIPALELSSTEVREALLAGQNCSDRIPPSVQQYITDHGLYRENQ